MEFDTRECMFCHAGLPPREGQPVNLAFMDHIRQRPSCRDAFDAWRTNMQKDFLGD